MGNGIHEQQTSTLLGNKPVSKQGKRSTRKSGGTTEKSNLKGMSVEDLKKELIEKTRVVHRQENTIKGLRLALDTKEVAMEEIMRRYNNLAGCRLVRL